MSLDDNQRQALAKSIISIAIYGLTAVPLGFFVSTKDISIWVYLICMLTCLFLLCVGIYLSRKPQHSHDQLTADIRKGIFHITTAQITHDI